MRTWTAGHNRWRSVYMAEYVPCPKTQHPHYCIVGTVVYAVTTFSTVEANIMVEGVASAASGSLRGRFPTAFCTVLFLSAVVALGVVGSRSVPVVGDTSTTSTTSSSPMSLLLGLSWVGT